MSRKYILRTKIFRPLVDREVYTLRTTEQVFPGGEWVEGKLEEATGAKSADRTALHGESPSARDEVAPTERLGDERPDAPPSSNLTIIGDTKNPDDVVQYLMIHNTSPVDRVVLGRLPSGRGAETKIAAALKEVGIEVLEIEHDPDLYGKSDVNVEQVMSHDLTSPVLLVGNGTRVKTAKSWLARAEWDREVITL